MSLEAMLAPKLLFLGYRVDTRYPSVNASLELVMLVARLS
jgi:hypothetical protein